jgi:type II secretory pathway component PulF
MYICILYNLLNLYNLHQRVYHYLTYPIIITIVVMVIINPILTIVHPTLTQY